MVLDAFVLSLVAGTLMGILLGLLFVTDA